MRKTFLARTLRGTAFAVAAGGWSATVMAAGAPILEAELDAGPAKVELIDNSRLGCGQGLPLWTASTGGTQCAFDTATRGARVTARHEVGAGSIEAYAAVTRTTTGAFTPDQLLVAPDHRTNEATDFVLMGLKGSAFEGRLEMTAEFARADRVIDRLVQRDWTLADQTSDGGTSALIRAEATLADKPGLKWSLTAEYRSVHEDYWIGRSAELATYHAMPGTRLALTSKARIGELGLLAGMERRDSLFGRQASLKGGADWDGISLRLLSRKTETGPVKGTTMLGRSSRIASAYIDLDLAMLAMRMLPAIDLPFLVPTTVSLTYRTGEMESRSLSATQRYSRSSLGIDGSWDTPIGETGLGYWRDARVGMIDEANGWSTETFSANHFVRRGNWSFGLDASLSRSRFEGGSGSGDRSISYGQSVAYSAPGGPQFRLQLGQDRGWMRAFDDSYVAADRSSLITASLDLSPYLQKRFERPDLRLTLDYRKALDRTDVEAGFYDDLVERWVDGDRREGFLMSFGMKL